MTLDEMAEMALPKRAISNQQSAGQQSVGVDEMIRRIVNEVVRIGEDKTCADCLNPLKEVFVRDGGYWCLRCGSKVCVFCGCTEAHACLGPEGVGCHWAGPGMCSTHVGELDAKLKAAGFLTR